MPNHEYSPAGALELLLQKVGQVDSSLGERIKTAIDAGRDREEQEPPIGKARRRRGRVYRKHVPYTDEEALQVALAALRAHFFELPQIVNAALDEFKEASVGLGATRGRRERQLTPSRGSETRNLQGEEKQFEIEIETEATLTKTNVPTRHVTRYEPASIEEVGRRIGSLKELLIFGATHGNTPRS